MIRFIYTFIIYSLGVLFAFNATDLALLLAKPFFLWINTGNISFKWQLSDIKMAFDDEYAVIGISVFVGFALALNSFKRFF